MDSDTSSDYEANASAFAFYVTHDDGSSMDINSDYSWAANVLSFADATVPCMAWLLDCVSFLHRIYTTYVMIHTGTHRIIVLLGAGVNNAKPYTFSQVHVYVHTLSHCFKFLYNRCVGASRNCHRVPFLHCASQLSGWGPPYRVCFPQVCWGDSA